ncbi:MAG: hypothetical protein IKK63_05630 [Clostridia bacterium]|nr:hypothetical protein [Clostridia bacterium]
MKAFKKAVALVLCLVMTVGIFAVAGITVDDLANLFPKAEAAITLGGITQQRVISNHESLYRSYQKRFFNGEETNWPTNFVIPGLGSADDYTPQGMTYWKAKEWILISAYDAGGSDNSVIYALDVVSTDLVAVFKIQNADGSVNTSHGGGIAASEYNFYYADADSKISYIPLSEMDVAKNTVKEIRLRDSIDLSGEMTAETTVKTSYCCYDEGVLWTGNFYLSGNASYGNGFLPSVGYPSILFGYKLAGNSSAEEWYYLKNGYNLVKLNQSDGSVSQTSGTITYNTYTTDGANAEIRGKVTTDTALGEATASFATVKLTEGVTYKIEFIADNNLSDMYMFAPKIGDSTPHCNVKQSQQSKITNLGDGRYHYQMIFTAGLKPAGADSSWPATQSTNGNYTGTYTVRFDQDSVPAGGRTFNITDFSVTEYVEPQGFTPDSKYEGIGCEGNPTYVVGLNTDRVQYAMVDKGKIYISRSWSRTESTNHVRELVIGDIDLGIPGESTATINGRNRTVHLFDYNSATKFNGSNMLWMGEALCVIDDYLYMFGEGAAWTYNGKEDSKCGEPIDVIWKIDQYAVQGLTRTHEDVTAVEYEKVNSLSEINNVDEYIVLYESPEKDPVTQDNILYLLDAYGGYGDKKLPKKAAAANVDSAFTGDSIGVVGYEIRDYSVKTENGKTSLILSAEDDANKSLHWQFESGSSTSLILRNRDLYYAKHPYFYMGDTLFAMTTTPSSTMTIKDWGNGEFTIYGNGSNYSLWCNDGTVANSIAAYSYLYANHGYSDYPQNYHGLKEIAGTFHITNGNQPALPTNEQQGMYIYKRVSDPYTSSYETQVYTDLNAELTSDGTYNITLETYATNNLQYQRVEERPTDFIFVLDTSGTLDKTDTTTYYTESGWETLSIESIVGEDNTSKPSSAKVHGYQLRTGTIYYKTTNDGRYHPVYAAVRTTERSTTKCKQSYWAYYISVTDGKYYMMYSDGTVATTGITYNDLVSLVDNNSSPSATVSDNQNSDRKQTVVYRGPHYSLRNDQRISGIKNAVDSLTYTIAAQANATGFDHRIAVVTFGSDGSIDSRYTWTGTNLYTNSGSAISYPNITTANYQNAFFSVSQFGTVRNIVNNLTALGHTFPSYGIEMASKIIDNSAYDYDVNGTRSAVVIVISDGTPGGDENGYYNVDTAKQVANDAIGNGAYNLKRNGAYVYSVLVGDDTVYDEAQFNKYDFMKYLSSEYTGSKSLTDPGPFNTKEGVNYYMQLPIGSSFNLESFTNQVFNEVVANSNNAIASLTTEAILREHLTDAFDLTNATITYQTAKSKYDGIGRLYFEAPKTASGFTTTFDKANNNIEVKGFDYSAKNVSEYNSNLGNGEKLIVTISGVIAKHDKELLNTSINDTSKTALYQNRSYMSDTLANDKPVKRFPTYHFTIPEYTYYMDYDIPMYDSDINGTLCSVDSTLQKQSTYKTSLSTGNMGIQFVNENLDMVYTLNSQAGLTENLSKGYVLIQRDDGTYDWFRLNIVPASTVYYEENKMETLDGTQSFTEWTESGSFDGKYQSLSTKDDVFGSDKTYYNSNETFSLGTHKQVTVTSSSNRSDTQSFTFTGTGFDLISACGSNTGIQTVTVKQHQTDGSMKIVKVFMVDTFYNDATYRTIYQVPVVQFKGAYGTYTVETTAAYYSFAGGLVKTQSVDTYAVEGTELEATSAVADTFSTDELFAQVGMDELIGQEVELVWMDDDSVLNGGLGVQGVTLYTQTEGSTATPSLVNYLDGFRIYNPNTYNDEYIASEKNASYYSVIDAITAGGMGGDALTAYIEPGAEGEINFGNYLTSGGPKYEVYLKPGHSIAFRFKADNSNRKAMISLRAASGTPGTPQATVGASGAANSKSFDIKSASETYYDITDYLGNGDNGAYTVTITNSGSGLLAVDNIKITNASLVPLNGASLAELDQILSTQAVEVDPHEVKPTAYTFVQAPADDPNIDPEGSLPTLESVAEQKAEQDKFTAIIEMLKSFFARIIEFFKNALNSLPIDWFSKKI